jgi:hypothetical protein
MGLLGRNTKLQPLITKQAKTSKVVLTMMVLARLERLIPKAAIAVKPTTTATANAVCH